MFIVYGYNTKTDNIHLLVLL